MKNTDEIFGLVSVCILLIGVIFIFLYRPTRRLLKDQIIDRRAFEDFVKEAEKTTAYRIHLDLIAKDVEILKSFGISKDEAIRRIKYFQLKIANSGKSRVEIQSAIDDIEDLNEKEVFLFKIFGAEDMTSAKIIFDTRKRITHEA